MGGSVPVILDGVGDFPSLFELTAETEEAPNDARLTFSHDRFLEATEKLDVQTRESTDDAFAVALCKVKLIRFSRPHQREYILGRSSRGRVFVPRHNRLAWGSEKNGNFIILYQI